MASKTVTDEFQKHYGAYEYNSFVKDMIKWYYGGGYAPVAWCAISMSYMMNQMGLLDQIGGKAQNCYEMICNIQKAIKKTGKGKLYLRGEGLKKGLVIPRGSIIFILRSDPPMSYGSKKHVTSCATTFTFKAAGTYDGLGGNQDPDNGKPDCICTKKYTQSKIWAVFMPDYNVHPTLRKGDKGDAVKELQKDLIAIGLKKVTGTGLAARGNFATNTENVVKALQKAVGITQDGVVGPLTWSVIDRLLGMTKHSTTAQRNVNYRRGPGEEYKKLGTIREGQQVEYTTILNGFIYIPAKKGWSKSSYYNL